MTRTKTQIIEELRTEKEDLLSQVEELEEKLRQINDLAYIEDDDDSDDDEEETDGDETENEDRFDKSHYRRLRNSRH